MANTLTSAIRQIMDKTVEVARESSVMPRLIWNDVANTPMGHGNSVDLAIADSGTVRDVVAGVYNTNVNVTAQKISISMDTWREAPMHVSDKDFEEVMEGYLPAQLEENLRALINDVDTNILTKMYQATYQFVGTPATTPFATNLKVFATARKFLNDAAAPMTDRSVVLDPAAEGNALILGNFLKADERGDQGGIIDGQIGRKLGSQWYLDQNIPAHSLHSLNAATTLLTNATAAVGATTIGIDQTSLTGALNPGDLLTFTGSAQQYVVRSTATAASSALTAAVSPPVTTAILSNVAVTVQVAHTPNLHFHKRAFAMASRPLAMSRFDGLGNFQTVVDPVSGLVIRLEVSREDKQTTLSYDILYGVKMIKPEWSCRIFG